MLEILRKRELKNVTAVVTRYFGGKLLGAGINSCLWWSS